MLFRPVAVHVDDTLATLAKCAVREETPLTGEAAALTAMVDFRRVCPVTVEPDQKIDAALQKMIDARVRTLLVMADEGMVGLITSYDIQGQKPLQFLRGSDCTHPECRHEDIEVADIMTPVAALPTLRLEDVRKALVGDILQTFLETRQTHLLVTERPGGPHTMVRGLISLAEVERRLGVAPADTSAVKIELESSIFARPAT
ncbi:MAG: CBS domain-containing protein [Rhodanobacteraceae bacterium]|nr:MAG: CBS domain-containing protein [Rhodanobacteraceae bacterium]